MFMAMRIAVVGVGQALLGDDSAGLAVCGRLMQLLRARTDSLAASAQPNRPTSPVGSAPTPAALAAPQAARSAPAALHAAPDGHSALLILPAGPAPENCTAQLRQFAPDWVLLVDAARMGAPPGTLQWIPWDAAGGVGGSTHSLPLQLLCEYLVRSLGCQVSLLGIEPADTTLGAPLSPAVQSAVESAARQLAGLLLPATAGAASLVPSGPTPVPCQEVET